MKTLVLLSALVLLAFQVQANPIQETDEGTKTEEQPGEEDQDVSVSFEVPEVSARRSNGKVTCHCRAKSCRWGERVNGTCKINNLLFISCCR
ncbi:alpha-defensin 6/12-like [Arvicanthis niloticus]|uniref:alpha-defensin 6/12-like n=1 Tax=Arvicanthis niloticus TaxID=61156 RepID=UPI001486A584|nr:alpha-defensin 6/12-like [Arvicanthis niloticus]